MKKKWTWADVDWVSAGFLIGVPLVSAISIPLYFSLTEVPFEEWILTVTLGLTLGIISNLSITAGYHRLFSHRSYEAHPILRFGLLLVGAGAWQNSCLKWSSDHRLHHTFVDKDKDPYAITKGFFYAHFGWMLLKDPEDRVIHAPDLEKDWMVRAQHNYYIPIAIFMGFLLPALLASLWGNFWGGLWIAGCLRITLTQHSTFLVNSLSHTLGKRPYSTEISARDSLLVAVLTHGEGYHNFHHKFQSDYRNAIRWWQWDPTKWVIWTCAQFGLAHKLKKVSNQEILKARLQTEAHRLMEKGFSHEKLDQLKERILKAQMQFKKISEDYKIMKKQFSHDSRERLEQMKVELKLAQLEFQVGLKLWRIWLQSPVPV